MAIGEIRPVKAIAHRVNRDDDDPMFPKIARGTGDQHPKDNAGQDKEEPHPEGNTYPKGQADPEGQANPEGNAEPQGNEVALPRGQRRVDVDMILEHIAQPGRPTTRSRT